MRTHSWVSAESGAGRWAAARLWLGSIGKAECDGKINQHIKPRLKGQPPSKARYTFLTEYVTLGIDSCVGKPTKASQDIFYFPSSSGKRKKENKRVSV